MANWIYRRPPDYVRRENPYGWVPSGTLTDTRINVGVGNLTLAGFIPLVLEGQIVDIPAGSLTLTGLVPAALENTIVNVPAASLTLTGLVPTAGENIVVDIPSAALTLAGFVPVPGENIVVDVPLATLTLTGFIPVPGESILVDVPSGVLTLTGFTPVFDLGIEIPAGTLTLTGFIPTAGENVVVDVPTAALTLTGLVPVAQTEIVIDVPPGTLSLTGFAPAHDISVIVDFAQLTLTGFAPVALETIAIEIPVGTLTLAGFAPIPGEDIVVNVPTGSLTLNGFAPVTIFNIVVNIPTGALNLVGTVPTLNEGVSTPAASLNLTGLTPTVLIAISVSVPAAALALSGFVPSAIQNTPVEIPSQSLTLTGFAPSVVETVNDIVIDVPIGTLTLIGLTPVGLVGGDGAVAPGAGILQLTGFEPNLVLTIFNIESCDMDIIFAKPVDELIIPALQDIEFNLDRLKNIEFPDPVNVEIREFNALEPVAPSKEVERIKFLYVDFANTIQDVIDGKIAELTNEVKPYDVETTEWARSKEDLLEEDEEAIEGSFDDEAARGFIAPSGVFNKDLSKQSTKSKKKLSRANEAFFSGQRQLTQANISAGLEAGNRAENVVRTTDQNRQTINLQAAQFLTELDFRVFEVHLQKHNTSIEVKRIKHQAYIEELKGQLLKLQEREIAIKGHALNVIEQTKQVEMFNAAVDFINAQQGLKQIELDNFLLQAETERNKLLKFQAEVDKFSALINLNIAKFNLYKAGIEFEESKVDQYREEAAVAEAQLQVQNAKTNSGRIRGDTKLDIANANLQAQLEKLRAARNRLDTDLTTARARTITFSGDLLVYQAQLREWIAENSHSILEETDQFTSESSKEISELRDSSRKLVNKIRFDTEGQNIQDLADLNAQVISTSADISARTEITSKLVHQLAGG